MLVEHREKLAKLKKNENIKEKPDLDQQLYEIFNYKIKEAIENDYKLKIIYYKDKDYKEVISSFKSYDTNNNRLLLTNNMVLCLDDIVDVIICK